jgi:hypothetical protein
LCVCAKVSASPPGVFLPSHGAFWAFFRAHNVSKSWKHPLLCHCCRAGKTPCLFFLSFQTGILRSHAQALFHTNSQFLTDVLWKESGIPQCDHDRGPCLRCELLVRDSLRSRRLICRVYSTNRGLTAHLQLGKLSACAMPCIVRQ